MSDKTNIFKHAFDSGTKTTRVALIPLLESNMGTNLLEAYNYPVVVEPRTVEKPAATRVPAKNPRHKTRTLRRLLAFLERQRGLRIF